LECWFYTLKKVNSALKSLDGRLKKELFRIFERKFLHK